MLRLVLLLNLDDVDSNDAAGQIWVKMIWSERTVRTVRGVRQIYELNSRRNSSAI
jgi:hypothetical protein